MSLRSLIERLLIPHLRADTFVMTYLILFIVDHIPGLKLRSSEDAEILGIDETEVSAHPSAIRRLRVLARRLIGRTFSLSYSAARLDTTLSTSLATSNRPTTSTASSTRTQSESRRATTRLARRSLTAPTLPWITQPKRCSPLAPLPCNQVPIEARVVVRRSTSKRVSAPAGCLSTGSCELF